MGVAKIGSNALHLSGNRLAGRFPVGRLGLDFASEKPLLRMTSLLLSRVGRATAPASPALGSYSFAFTTAFHPRNRSFSSSSKTHSKTHPGYTVGRSGKTYSPTVVKLVGFIGRILGYNIGKSNAITLTSDYYDRCAERFDAEKSFWTQECGLPDSFQAWFQITQLHMWLLMVRFRSMKPPLGRFYCQELVNHAFIDIEHRLRGPQNKVTQNALVKKYMEILLHQHLGSQASLDWAIVQERHSDQLLAGSIWRNIFGAAWGNGMGGVHGIFQTDSQPTSSSKMIDRLLLNSTSESGAHQNHSLVADVEFAAILEKMVTYIRKETVRLDQISDQSIVSGLGASQGGITNFSPI